VQVLNSPEQDPSGPEAAEKDPLARFRSWRGFLFAAIALNLLFLYSMLGAVADPGTAAWFKALSWLPFNFIATVLYFVFLTKLTKADGADQANANRALYVVLCLAMIAVNWVAMFAA